MKKKILSIFIMLVLTFGIIGCGKTSSENNSEKNSPAPQTAESAEIKIAALKGPTSMGLAKLFDDAKNDVEQKNSYTCTILQSPDEVVVGLSKGDFDVAAIPANLASVLYNKTEGKLLKVANINTLGVLYIASKDDSIKSVEDLRGKTIITSGKGATPEFVLRHVLSKHNINPDTDVTIDFKTEHQEVVSSYMLRSDNSAVVMLPQPFLTVAEDLVTNLSINDLWQEVNDSKLVTGVLVVRNEFLNSHKEAFDNFMEEYKSSVEFVNSNTDEASKIIAALDIVPEPIAKTALPQCNIVYIDGAEMKETLSNYLQSLYDEDAKSVGGNMPDENFYYEK